MTKKENFEESFMRLHHYLKECRYKGYEFDDLLSSPIVKLFTFNILNLQRVAIQMGQRFPLPIRPLLGVKKKESTKARGFIARGYLYRYLADHNSRWLDLASESLDWLLQNSSQGFQGMSWGNNFDFATGMGFYPAGWPTIVWTSHIAATFEMSYVITKKEEYLEALMSAAEFIVSSLERTEDEDGICFAYAPGIPVLVHNANLLGAATLLRCWKYTQDKSLYDLAKSSYRWSISRINPDGSWYYRFAPPGARNWIDNFHTAYNIDCFAVGHEIAGEDIIPSEILKRSYGFWIQNFFLTDGTPRYYHDKTYPLNIQCASQAIETFAKLSAKDFPGTFQMAEKVLEWTIQNMQKHNGAFRYKIARHWKNNLESIHWGESTMLAALGAFLFYSSEEAKKRPVPYI
jgi:hypothetical protein